MLCGPQAGTTCEEGQTVVSRAHFGRNPATKPRRAWRTAARLASALLGVAALLAAGAPRADTTEEFAAEPGAPPPATLRDIAAYQSALQIHLERNPALATAYVVFLAGLENPGESPESRFATLARNSETVREAVGARYGRSSGRYRLADTLTVALGALAGDDEGVAGTPERLLGLLDRSLAPRVRVDGRYAYAGSVAGRADLGHAATALLGCRAVPACVAAHDALFAPAMAGVSLTATYEERMEHDERLAASSSRPLLEAAPALEATGTPVPAALEAARAYLDAIAGAATGNGADSAAGPDELAVLFTLGRSAATLAGSEPLADAFGVLRQPTLDLARLGSGALAGGSALTGGFLAATAGAGLLIAGVQALALFDGPGRGEPPAELRRLITDLERSTSDQLAELRSDLAASGNATDTRLAALAVALDVVRDDVARIESSQRARVRASFLAQDTQRRSGFEEDDDRCFSLRNRDATGRLRAAEFRRCEERFLQGAVRRSRYGTRSTDYLLDARHLEPADARFPFHHHYPLLLGMGGVEQREALALPDPLEWQQHAAALLRLYQENPAGDADHAKRAEVLANLRAAGTRTHDALAGLAVQRGDDGRASFRADVHEEALDAYFDALESLLRRVRALDDPDADLYGKRLTESLLQPLPVGRKRTALEAELLRSSAAPTLAACGVSDDEAFLLPAGGLLDDSRRFFGAPLTEDEVAAAWHREAIAGFGLAPPPPAALLPPRYAWAALSGLGRLDICLSRFRPEAVAFTRESGLVRDHFRGEALLTARLEVRFSPGEELRAAGHAPRTVAAYAASRSCSFSYRRDAEGCSRGECLALLAPAFWGDEDPEGARCEDGPLAEALPSGREAAPPAPPDPLDAALEKAYWDRRSAESGRLEADALRSSEYEAAAAHYLRYYALAAITLGTHPDLTGALAPMYSPAAQLAPRAIVEAVVRERTDVAALRAELRARRSEMKKRVAAHGAAVTDDAALRRLPHLAALRETLARIDLMLGAYRA